MNSRVAVILLSYTASCYGGLLGAGHGEGSCAAAPFRTPIEALKWPAGCPAGAECCTEYGYCRPQAEWLAKQFRDCNGVSNGIPLPLDVIDAENAAAALGDTSAAALIAAPAVAAAAPLPVIAAQTAPVAAAPAVAVAAAPAVASYAAAPAVASYAAAPAVASYAAAPVVASYNYAAPAAYAASPVAAYAAAPAAAYAAAPVAQYAGQYVVSGVH